jgi:integrase
MHDGGPRSRARSIETVWNHMNWVRPALLAWSARYQHLREVTRDDVLAVLEPLHGTRRSNILVALRSLFAFATKHGMIFRNPTRGITVGQHPYGILQPLQPRDVDQAVAAATTPAGQLILALAAVHAARSGAIRAMRLDDVDIGNRRLVIAGRVRPLDDLTRHVLLDWLHERRTRWPNTANPHLLINQQTATETGPVSTFWAKKALRGHAATLERLRMDRQLEEALTRGPDPLHLAAVFGLDPKTAIRYAETARQLLTTTAEQPTPYGSQRTQGSSPSMETEDP